MAVPIEYAALDSRWHRQYTRQGLRHSATAVSMLGLRSIGPSGIRPAPFLERSDGHRLTRHSARLIAILSWRIGTRVVVANGAPFGRLPIPRDGLTRSHDLWTQFSVLRFSHRFARLVRARPRLYGATAVGIAVSIVLPHAITSHPATRFLIAWNSATFLYLALAAWMMVHSSPDHMRERARRQNDGKIIILLLVILSGVASLAAIAGQLAIVKDMGGRIKVAHGTLAAVTVMSSWAFIHIMFAMHYAHDYYGAISHDQPPGLLFPGDEQPDYGDFCYFAAVIGTSGQTADVSFTSRPMRRIGTIHCVVAYVFNTTVLALVINIAASLF